MSIKGSIKKVKLQFIEMRQGWVYLYSKFFRFNKTVPNCIAKAIGRKNKKELLKLRENKPLFIPTYDGSGQAVHPDILYWKDQYWMTCTPYPYGVDTYENPCIYTSKDNYNWQVPDGCINPLAYPSINNSGYHLSDPCLLAFKNSLMIYYRETHKINGVDKSYIKMISSTDGQKWSNPIMVMQSETDSLISPALLSSQEHCFMFHVRLQNPYGGTIILSESDDGIN